MDQNSTPKDHSLMSEVSVNSEGGKKVGLLKNQWGGVGSVVY